MDDGYKSLFARVSVGNKFCESPGVFLRLRSVGNFEDSKFQNCVSSLVLTTLNFNLTLTMNDQIW